MRYFVDTCIWIDLIEDRKGKNGEPLGRYAAEALSMIILIGDVIIYNREIFRELKKDDEIRDALSGTMMHIDISTESYDEAAILSERRELPFMDCIIAVFARENSAVILTRDRHFCRLSDIARAISPYDLLHTS